MGSAVEQRQQAVAAIQGDQVVAAADVRRADVDLRHGAPAGALDHGLALAGVVVDADLFQIGYAAGLEQGFGALAVGTVVRAVHDDFLHDACLRGISVFASRAGRPTSLV